MKTYKLLILSLVLVSTTAFADLPGLTFDTGNGEGRLRHNVYLGVSVLAFNRTAPLPGDVLLEGLLDANYRPFIGYRFNDYVAIESAYLHLVDVSTNKTIFGDPIPEESSKISGGDLSLVLNYPFLSGFNVYGKVGVAVVHTKLQERYFWKSVDIDEIDFLPEVGGGVDYYFKKRFSIGLTATNLFGMKNTPRMTTFGLRTSFIF